MRAKEIKLNKLLIENDNKFTIPIFQRKYSWTEKQCLTLWEDIKKLSTKDENTGHFIGSIVCYDTKPEYLPGEIHEKILIDGQQRLTTLSLIMLAIARVYENKGEKEKAWSIKKNFIFNIDYKGEDYYKLVPTYEDKETFFAIAKETETDLKEKSKQMLDNFNLFCSLLENNEELEKIYLGVNRLDLVYVVLSKGQDDPQVIFESMNSTGMELKQGDLLRNYLLLDCTKDEQIDLYEKYWKPIEQDFGREGYIEKFDYFLRDYLTMLEKKTIKLDMGYEEFKEYYREKNYTKEEILRNLRTYSKYYSRIYNCTDEDKELNELWKELKTQQLGVANPFLIQVYNDYEESKKSMEDFLSKEDFKEIVKTIASYVFRRYIVGIPTNSLNKTFAVLYNSVDKKNYKKSIIIALQLLDSYKKFPTDTEFKEAFITKDIYNLRLKNYILEKLENNRHYNNIKIDGEDISIEHILPENPNLNKEWQKALGENYKELQKNYVHRIGNLTITKGVYNSMMRDYPFLKKINVVGGIKASHYRLSDDVVYQEDENKNKVERKEWNIESIKERSERLAEEALEIWPYQKLTEEELAPYINLKNKKRETYQDITHLPTMNEIVKNTFEKYDQEILALDEKITKTIAKHYIAYKYDYINFAEIIIYKNSINIILDIPYDLLEDELNICENISDKGSWGTGTVRIRLTDTNNFNYILNLIKQSLENEKNMN